MTYLSEQNLISKQKPQIYVQNKDNPAISQKNQEQNTNILDLIYNMIIFFDKEGTRVEFCIKKYLECNFSKKKHDLKFSLENI